MSKPTKTFDPTPEQAAIIAADRDELVVRAAAGAGKTFVLVERYLGQIDQGLSPDQILTITFTRKAAAEMKRRIVDRLAAKGLKIEAQIAETGPIQTIHGFCERLLRENAVAAGLDPDYTILSGAQSARLYEEAVREAVANPPDERAEAAQLIERLAGKRSFAGVSQHAKLIEAVTKVLHGLRGTGVSAERLARTHFDPEELLGFWHSSIHAELPQEVVASYLETNPSLTHFLRLRDAFTASKVRKPRWLKVHPDTAEASAEGDSLAAAETCGLAQIAARAWWLLDRAMNEQQALDFTALEARAVDLLTNSEEARQRVGRQYRSVLIDEAQDLNPMQVKLLEGLEAARRLFVGDPQQSIYGFRQADVELFRDLMQRVEPMQLTQNKRSDDGILSFVDRVFGDLWAGSYMPMRAPSGPLDLNQPPVDSYEGIELWRQRDRDSAAVAAAIEEMLSQLRPLGIKPADVAVLVRKRAYAVDLQPKLEAHGFKVRIVGGSERFYTRMEVRDLANVLRSVAAPEDDYALLACLRSPVAGLSLDSIVMLSYRARSEGLPVSDLLQNFEVPVEEDRPLLDRFLGWYLPLRAYGDRLAAWEVLSSLFADTPYLERLAQRNRGNQLIANVRKLLSLAVAEPEMGPLEYERRIREIQELRHNEGDAQAEDTDEEVITLMTIHSAKGLEFPVVVLPETHWAPKTNKEEIEIEPKLATLVTNFGRRASTVHDWLASKRHEREREEEDRILYVAMTRAKRRLCLCLHPQSPAPTFAARLAKTLGFKADPLPNTLLRDLDGRA